MKENVLKISEKSYNTIKDLSDKELGRLIKSLCLYVFGGKIQRPKSRVLRVMYDVFKDKIDTEIYFRETGKLGGIKSNSMKQKVENNSCSSVDIIKVGTLDELIKFIFNNPLFNERNKSASGE